MNKKMCNFIIVLSSFLGLLFTFFGNNFMSNNSLYYFTIESNIWILMISFIFLIFDIFKIKIPNFLYIIKYIFTVSITLTFIIFNFVIVPQMLATSVSLEELFCFSNVALHMVSPLFAVYSFIFFDKELKIKKNYYLFGITMPLLYFIFCIVLSNILVKEIFVMGNTVSKFPYFFMNYIENGWFNISLDVFKMGTFYWVFIIAILVIGSSKLLLYFNQKKSTN